MVAVLGVSGADIPVCHAQNYLWQARGLPHALYGRQDVCMAGKNACPTLEQRIELLHELAEVLECGFDGLRLLHINAGVAQ